MEEKSVKYLQWKLSKIEERCEAEREAWIQDSTEQEQKQKQKQTEDLLREKVKALQAKVETAKEKEKEQEVTIKLFEADRDKRDKDIAVLEKHVEISNERHAKLTQEFSNYKESSEKNLTELKQGHGNIKLGMQADFDNVQRAARQHEEQSKKFQHVVIKQDIDYHVLKERHRVVVGKLQDCVTDDEEERTKQIFEDLKVKMDIISQNEIKEAGYESRLTKLRKQITALDNLKSLPSIVEQLNATVEEKCRVIKNKILEIAALKKEKKVVTERWEIEQDKTALLDVQIKLATDKIKRLEEKIKQEASMHKNTRKQLDEAKGLNEFLTEKLQGLDLQMKGSGTHTKHLKEQVQQLQTSQRRFEEDLQTCMSVINKPIQLKQRVIDLNRHYIEDDKKLQIGENTEKAYRFNIDCLQKKLAHAANIERANGSIMKKMEQRLLNVNNAFTEKEVRYITLLNDEIVKVQKLEKELKETTSKLQKATKPAPQKIRSWINKKVLGNRPVVPPHLNPDDWQPPGFPDDNVTSSEDPATDDMMSASGQPHPSTPVMRIIHVRPYMDDGIPPVDI